MPHSRTYFATVKGDEIIHKAGAQPTYGANYLKSFEVAKFTTEGESITIHISPANVLSIIDIPVKFTLEGVINYIDNHNDCPADLTFTSSSMEYSGTGNTYTIIMSEGLAYKLGYEPNKEYTINDTDNIIYSQHPISSDPQYLKLYINGKYVATNYPKKDTQFHLSYPVYEYDKAEISSVEVKDDTNSLFYVPATFQITYVEDFRYTPAQRKVSTTEYYRDDSHMILEKPGTEFAFRNIFVDNKRYFSGDETLILTVTDVGTGNVISVEYITMPKGYLSIAHYMALEEFTWIDSSTLNKYTDPVYPDWIYEFTYSDIPDTKTYRFVFSSSYTKKFEYMMHNAFGFEHDCTNTTSSSYYENFTKYDPIVGIMFPSVYKVNVHELTHYFTNTFTSTVEWKDKFAMSNVPLQVESYTREGKKIRVLDKDEFLIEFLFR